MKFEAGKYYVDRDGNKYEYMSFSKELDSQIFISCDVKGIAPRCEDGKYYSLNPDGLEHKWDIIAEYQEPKKEFGILNKLEIEIENLETMPHQVEPNLKPNLKRIYQFLYEISKGLGSDDHHRKT